MNISIKSQGVSVIICCYNSTARLYETLRHLSLQKVPGNFSWEVILVNNASTDNTVEFANEVWKSFNRNDTNFRIVEEGQPGQMFARKKGINEAAYESIIFCDDDNWLGEEYVFYAHKTLIENEEIGAAGGQNLPVTDADKYPDWWEPYKDKYALGIPAKQSGDVSHRGFVLGAGLVTRKALFLQAFDDKYPSLLNGRNGESLSTGDDFEYCKRILLWGYKLYYEQKLVLKHFIPKERLTVSYRDRLMQGIEDASTILNEYDQAILIQRKHGHKNKLKLRLLAPFRILLAKQGLSSRNAEEEELKLFYLTSAQVKADSRKVFIKRFLNHQ